MRENITRKPGSVGHDSQSVPGEIFAGAHFHLIAEGQTSPCAEGDGNNIGGSVAFNGERFRELRILTKYFAGRLAA